MSEEIENRSYVEFMRLADELGIKIVNFVVDDCEETSLPLMLRAMCLVIAKQLAESATEEEMRTALDHLKGCLEKDTNHLFLLAKSGGISGHA